MHEETITQEEIPLRDYLDMLRRRIAIIIQTVIAALVIGVVIALVSANVYRSSGKLLITPMPQQVVAREASDPLSTLNQYQVQNIQTQLQVLMNGKLISDAKKAAGVNPSDPNIKIQVGQELEDVNIIQVTVDAGKPDAAEAVANSLMDLYLMSEQKTRSGDIDSMIAFAEQQVKDADKEWRDASQQLQKLQDKTRTIDYQEAIKSITTNASALSGKEAEYQQSVAALKATMDKVKAQRDALKPTVTKNSEQTNPQLLAMRADLVKQTNERDSRRQLFNDDHPTMKALNAGIKSLEEQIANAPKTIRITEEATNPEILEKDQELRKYDSQMQALIASRSENDKQRERTSSYMQELGKYQYAAAVLKQKMDIAQERSKMLQEKLADLKLRQTASSHPISILERAALNPTPVKPKRPLIIGIALIAGLFLGVCFALLAEFLDDRINAPDDARRILGVPALGYIPRVDREEQRMLTSDAASGSLLESYRVLRSNVRFAAVGEPLSSIMITSTVPGEGKSVTAANLAIAMALDGKKVILVDADLRRPTVHEKFNVRNTPGLTNVLVGALTLDQALQASVIENLYLLPSGPLPPNPAELLNSRAMEQVQEMLKERADIVIFDSPPCLSVADAQVLAATVDGLIYVVQLGSTKKSALKHGHELLRQAHARILGVVYNKMQVDGRRNDYYYGYYSYYHKKELPGKSNGNGHKNGGSSEWSSMVKEGEERTPALAEASKTSVPSATEEKEG